VRIAKQLSIQYLFIDCLAIDQNLEDDQLLGQIVSFSSFYSKLRVIAAYGMEGEEYANTLHRPWIFSEIRTMVKNRYRVTYAGHIIDESSKDRITKGFLYIGWDSSFTSVAPRLLFGETEMKCHSDFKFLLPLYARLLSKA
jgi:hypothetical protein